MRRLRDDKGPIERSALTADILPCWRPERQKNPAGFFLPNVVGQGTALPYVLFPDPEVSAGNGAGELQIFLHGVE